MKGQVPHKRLERVLPRGVIIDVIEERRPRFGASHRVQRLPLLLHQLGRRRNQDLFLYIKAVFYLYYFIGRGEDEI